MKWIRRIFIAFLLLPIVLWVAAWIAFPLFAPALLRNALQGPSHNIELKGLERPGLGEIGFDAITASIITPPGPCSPDAPPSTYKAFLGKGRIGWNLDPFKLLSSGILNARLTLESDSFAVQPESADFVFSDSNSVISATLNFNLRSRVPSPFELISISYPVKDATLRSGKISAHGVNFPLLLNPQNGWTPMGGTITVKNVRNGADTLPVANITASLPARSDTLNPCTLSLLACSADLYGMHASSDSIAYDMKNKRAASTLTLKNINIGELPGLKREGNEPQFASGTLQGVIPFVYSDTTLTIRNASLAAGNNTSLSYYNRENRQWLTIELNDGPFIKKLNATASITSKNGLSISGLNASLLRGTISAAPTRYNFATGETSLLFTLKNLNALETVHFHGDFGGKLTGSVSGTIPVTVSTKGVSIPGARIRSEGGGTITITDPATGEASYAFSKPALVLRRNTNGSIVVDFRTQELKRMAGGGELLLNHPAGRAMLFADPENPDIVTLSNFSAGFFNATMSIARIDYDMLSGSGETSIHFSSLPLQKLLDMQGTKKVYATGTLSGSIPVRMENKTFAIRDGGMNTEQEGQIIYATTPQERAAANPGLRITYDALTNFLYRDLTSSIDMDPDGQSVIALHLKGRNPDYQNGRPIEINLTIRQNLLDLMRSLSISSSIEQAISEKALQKKKP